MKDILKRYFSSEKIEIDGFLSICKRILNNKLEINVNENNFFIIRKNTRKPLHEYFFETLNIIGVPSKKEYVLKKVLE